MRETLGFDARELSPGLVERITFFRGGDALV